MTLYHPRALADKLEGLVPELQRWSHRASMALDNAQIQQKRIEDRQIQTGHSAQVHEQHLVVDQEAVRNGGELLQVCERNCLEALAQAQQTASAVRSILHKTQTIYNRMQQALRNAQEVLAQAEQALAQATAKVEKHREEFTTANAGQGQDDKRAANYGLSVTKKAQNQANRAVRVAAARVANCTKMLTLVSQALQQARVLDQQAQAGLKTSEDSMGFARAAERALDLGQRELGQEEAIVKATAEAVQYTVLLTEEASIQLAVANEHEQPAQQHTAETLRILQIKIGLLLVMNRPDDLDGFSGARAASLQLAADTDRGELAQIQGPKLERLLTRLNEIEALKPRWWSTLDLKERVEVLQNAHNVVAAVYRFDPSPVQVVKLPPQEGGNFSDDTEIIQINMKFVAGNDGLQSLKTLMHESRHAYQWHFVKHVRRGFGWHSEADWTVAQEWSDNFYDYKYAERFGFQEYLGQPIEIDARSFAETVTKQWFGK